MLTRRRLLAGLIAAPAIVRPGILMPLRGIVMPILTAEDIASLVKECRDWVWKYDLRTVSMVVHPVVHSGWTNVRSSWSYESEVGEFNGIRFLEEQAS